MPTTPHRHPTPLTPEQRIERLHARLNARRQADRDGLNPHRERLVLAITADDLELLLDRATAHDTRRTA